MGFHAETDNHTTALEFLCAEGGGLYIILTSSSLCLLYVNPFLLVRQMIPYDDSVGKCGYLGLGHMGFPVFQASHGYFLANKWRIFCVDRDENRLSKIPHTSISKSKNLPNWLEILFLGVRPQYVQEIAKTTSDPRVVISMVAGVTCDEINGIWPTSHVIRIIPNTPCEYGSGITPTFVNKILIDSTHFKTIIGALSGLGKILFVSHENMIEFKKHC